MKILYKIIFIITLFVMFSATSQAQNSKTYYQALFILKFIKYTHWKSQPFVYRIGIVGNTKVISQLKPMVRNKRINGKKVILEKISSYNNLGKYSLIYIPKNQNKKFFTIIKKTKGKSVLIITEDARYFKYGSSISFMQKHHSLKFKVNKTSIEKRNMQVSRRLLSVAISVL